MEGFHPSYPINFSDGENRVEFDNIKKDVICEWCDDKLRITPLVLQLIDLPLPLSHKVFEFVLTPELLCHGRSSERFWNLRLVCLLNCFVANMALRPPVSVYRRFGLKAFIYGSYESNMMEQNGLWMLSDTEIVFQPNWNNERDERYIPAFTTALVAYF